MQWECIYKRLSTLVDNLFLLYLSRMIQLDLSQYKQGLKLKRDEKKRIAVLDPIRKKWLVLLPEEGVRQLLLLYLMETKLYPKGKIAVEKGLVVNQLSKRCDLLIYDRQTTPWMLIECKAPNVKITQEVFEQIARYNMPLQVKYLLVTNGITTYCCELNYSSQSFTFLEEIPDFPPKK